jgi:hypothetical protein
MYIVIVDRSVRDCSCWWRRRGEQYLPMNNVDAYRGLERGIDGQERRTGACPRPSKRRVYPF